MKYALAFAPKCPKCKEMSLELTVANKNKRFQLNNYYKGLYEAIDKHNVYKYRCKICGRLFHVDWRMGNPKPYTDDVNFKYPPTP